MIETGILAGYLMEELNTDSTDRGQEASLGLGHVPRRRRTPTNIRFDTSYHIY